MDSHLACRLVRAHIWSSEDVKFTLTRLRKHIITRSLKKTIETQMAVLILVNLLKILNNRPQLSYFGIGINLSHWFFMKGKLFFLIISIHLKQHFNEIYQTINLQITD